MPYGSRVSFILHAWRRLWPTSVERRLAAILAADVPGYHSTNGRGRRGNTICRSRWSNSCASLPLHLRTARRFRAALLATDRICRHPWLGQMCPTALAASSYFAVIPMRRRAPGTIGPSLTSLGTAPGFPKVFRSATMGSSRQAMTSAASVMEGRVLRMAMGRITITFGFLLSRSTSWARAGARLVRKSNVRLASMSLRRLLSSASTSDNGLSAPAAADALETKRYGHHQSQDREGARHHRSGLAPRPRRRGDRMSSRIMRLAVVAQGERG